MQTTKKSISPRITDESLSTVIEDTTVTMAPQKKEVEREESEYVKCSDMKVFREWGDRFGMVNFMVPTNGKNDQEDEYASINGIKVFIRKGIFVDLPRNVAELLANKFKIQMNLGSNMRIDGNKEKMERLS